jgi:glycosyltransferase involved in cell wall biosynthesis
VVRQISAVIPVRNNAADLPAAVESLLTQRGVSEIVLCVGPSHDGSLNVAETLATEHPNVQVLSNEHGGIPQALNLGLAQITGEILLRLDAHSVLPSDYAANALETMETKGATNVGAVQNPVGHTLVERAIAAAMGGRAGSGGADYRHGGGEPRKVDTAFLGFFNVAALRSLGGWDEAFSRNEDAELNARLAKAGYEIWLDPRLVVDYRPRPTLRSLAKQYFRYGPGRLQTIRKHPETLKLRQFAAPVIVVGLVAGTVLAITGSAWFWALPAVYAIGVLTAGLASEGPIPQRLVTAGALATMHVSWGAGFLLSAARSLFQRGST